jgi:carbamoyltransferase
MLGLARHVQQLTGARHLALAGGVALNCVANGVLLRSGLFEDIWIQPASGDAGGAVGAALLTAHARFGAPRALRPAGRDGQKGSYLGPAYSSAEIRAFLDRQHYPYEVVSDAKTRAELIAHAIHCGQIVGLFSGRMEFGPRALGARSLLGDARSPDTQARMNLKIKHRESFRPFAPTVLRERCADYFEVDVQHESPYMLLVAPVRAERRLAPPPTAFDQGDDDMLAVVRQARSDIPAVTHVDYSARIQTIRREDHQFYYDVLKAFERHTGCAVVVNTSFNVRGEPIVCSPQDAYRCFMRTDTDLLVLEDCVLRKSAQPPFEDTDWRQEFELD